MRSELGRRLAWAILGAVWLAGLVSSPALAVTWEGVRDGVVWVRAGKEPSPDLAVRWRDAWEARSHRESLWLQDPRGGLVERLRLDFAQVEGRHAFPTDRGAGDYRLEVPGLSFRYYDVTVPDQLPSVFEPVKVHFSMRARAGDALYFRVPEGASFCLGGKFHDGPDRIEIWRPDGTPAGLLRLERHKKYSRFDRLSFDQAPGGVWRIRFPEGGKVSFWLDGVGNYFARRPEDLFTPERLPGLAPVRVTSQVVGRSPRLGTMLEFADLPEKAYARLQGLGLAAANHYAFQEPLADRPDKDRSWLRVYRDRLGLTHSLTIFDVTRGERNPDLAGYGRFIRRYLESHAGGEAPMIAFYDEPNLIFDSEAAFLDAHRFLAEGLKKSGRRELAAPKIAAPESSGLVNGPTASGARRGADWLRTLLRTQGDMIDAVSWHEWMVRDLISTPWYAESVLEAARLDAEFPRPNAGPRELILAQTSISSGPDVSPYEHDTFFAALWWGSVTARAGSVGKLSVLNWFKSVDDPERYDKGLMRFDRDWTLKPVGEAMRFVAKAMRPRVLEAACDSAEVDVLAMTDEAGREVSILFVNKFPRTNQVRLALELPPSFGQAPPRWTLDSLAEEGGRLVERRESGALDSPFERDLAGETLYRLRIEPAARP